MPHESPKVVRMAGLVLILIGLLIGATYLYQMTHELG